MSDNTPKRAPPSGPLDARPQWWNTLFDRGNLSFWQLGIALQEQRRTGNRFEDVLVYLGFVQDDLDAPRPSAPPTDKPPH